MIAVGVNKVIFGGRTLVDMSDVSVSPEKLFVGETAFDKSGEMIGGVFSLEAEISAQDALIAQIQTALEGKAAGGGGASGGVETCAVILGSENPKDDAPPGDETILYYVSETHEALTITYVAQTSFVATKNIFITATGWSSSSYVSGSAEQLYYGMGVAIIRVTGDCRLVFRN